MSSAGEGSQGTGQSVRGGSFYDDPAVFERYSDHRRAGVGSPNVVMEEPALLGALGPVAGLQVLDLGCGDGSFGRTLLEAGCGTYLGIDGSRRMAAQAQRALQDTGGEVIVGDIEDFAGVPGATTSSSPA